MLELLEGILGALCAVGAFEIVVIALAAREHLRKKNTADYLRGEPIGVGCITEDK